MNLTNFAKRFTDWSTIPESVHPGASGVATVRTRQLGDIQLRLVTYSANYIADHWCTKGHIVFVVTGELIIEHQHGPSHTLPPSTSYHVGDDEPLPHRVLSKTRATVFIVD